MGAGAPAVILMAGSSSWSPVWYKVQPVIAQETRVCAFDRAGFGFRVRAVAEQLAGLGVEVGGELVLFLPIEDRLAAVASSLMGIATGASGPLRGGPVDEVVVQMRNSLCLVTRISEEASVAVVASPRCDLAELAYEMELFANQTGPLVGRALQSELQAQLPQ